MGVKIGNIDVSYFKVGGADCSIYLGDVKLYPSEEPTPPTPSGNCYEVIQTPITSYTSTTYDSVYSFADAKWHMLNNLSQYEEYGVYGSGRTGVTTYEGKLTIDGNYEYQYSGGSWVNVGEVVVTSGIEFSKTMSQGTAYDFVGVSIPTSFKILKSELDAIETASGYFSFTFQGQYNQSGYQDSLSFDKINYTYNGETSIMGTVTEEGNYYVYEMQGLDSFFIENSQYYESLDFTFNFTGSEIGFRGNTWGGSITFFDGVTIPTSFKIPASQIDEIIQMYGGFNMYIQSMNGSSMYITDSTYDLGTVTNDGTYYIYTPYSPSDFEIYQINLNADSIISMIFEGGGTSVPVSYADKGIPLSKVYNTVASMEAITCPNVGINEYGVVGNDVYQFEESEEWVNKTKSSFKFVAKYNDGNANVIVCNTSNELSSDETKLSYLSTDAMTSAVIGDCVSSIGSYVFAYCNSLTSVTIPSGVTSIGNGAFNGCSSLTSIDIPSGVSSISNYAFDNCTSLTSVTIPSGVTSIGKYAFDNCHGLTSVTIPSGVTSIGERAFNSCTSLTSVTIPSGVTSISNYAFSNCASLTSITIPSGVTSIGYSSFAACRGFTSIDIPSGVTSIGNYAFANCTSLTSITVNAITPPTLSRNTFNNTNDCPIYVPSASVDTYKAATNWSNYASRIEAIPT